MTLVSGLFSSCATPATSWPIAESFSACSSCACVAFSRSTVATQPAVGGGELVAHLPHPARVLDVERHVLGDLHDRGAVRRVEHGTRRHAEDAIAGKRDLVVHAAVAGGAADGARGKARRRGRSRRTTGRAATVTGRSRTRPAPRCRGAGVRHGRRPRSRRRSRRTSASHSCLPARMNGVEPRVLHADRGLVGDDDEQALIVVAELVRQRAADAQRRRSDRRRRTSGRSAPSAAAAWRACWSSNPFVEIVDA